MKKMFVYIDGFYGGNVAGYRGKIMFVFITG